MGKKFDARGFITLGGMAGILFTLIILFIRAGDKSSGSEDTDLRGKYYVAPVPVPDGLDFAGERVPLEFFDVRESLDMEMLVNTYWQSHTLLLIKRANRYFPLIEQIMAENGIPEDFKYLPVAESDLMNLVSPANAVGFWQFRKATALENGLEVNDEVDERYHLAKSTQAACEFLKRSYEIYGSWTMAAASYNVGRTGLNRQIERQGTREYYDLLLNMETGRYIYRILALKVIISDPETYGFYFEKEDLYPVIPTYDVSIDGPVDDFSAFAAEHGINYKVLKIFNPWLRDDKLTNSRGKTYSINIPQPGSRENLSH